MIMAEIIQIILSNNKKWQYVVAEFSTILHTNIIFGFSGLLGILKVLVSYDLTRGIILVVGIVHDGFWGMMGYDGV